MEKESEGSEKARSESGRTAKRQERELGPTEELAKQRQSKGTGGGTAEKEYGGWREGWGTAHGLA